MFRKQLLKEVGAGNMLLAKLNVNFANSIFIMSSNFNIEQLENSIFVGECNGRKRHVLYYVVLENCQLKVVAFAGSTPVK